jgi:SP family sugar:H+ symporter-like MFS transporter
MAISLAIDVIFAFILSYSVPCMITALGTRVGFIFMAFCIAVLLSVFFFVPELTGRSLEEVMSSLR